jgi:hypothetical protein
MKRAPLRRDTGEARMTVRLRKCAICRAPARREMNLKPFCSPECGLELAKRILAKQDRAADKVKLLKLKPLSYWEKRAERVVNLYVRLRDHDRGCISCDKPATWDGQWHCSHFRSVGAASAVRYHLWNLAKACSQCNNYKSGNLSEYEPRLRAKIGDAKVDWLRTQNQVTRYSREYLQRLHDVFAKKCRRLEKRIGAC